MLTLQDLRESTFPVVMDEDPEKPLIFNVFRNKKTRTAREQLRSASVEAVKAMEKSEKEADKLRGQIHELNKTAAIEAKTEELGDAIDSEEASEEKVATLRAELEALGAEREANVPKVEALHAKYAAMVEAAEDVMHEMVARQLAHYVESTSLRDGAAPDAPLIPATFEFFCDEFDTATLLNFSETIMGVLEGPLVTRRSIAS